MTDEEIKELSRKAMADLEAKLAAARNAVLCGAMTPDEYREKYLGLPPLPNGAGNVLVYPPNYRVEPAAQNTNSPVSPLPALAGDVN